MEGIESPIFITDFQVKSVLSWPLVNEAVEQALLSVQKEKNKDSASAASSYQPARSFTFTKDKNGVLLTMPGYVDNYALGGKKYNTLACKLVTSFNSNTKRDPPLPSILANILLFDSCTGKMLCIMDGTEITAWRTASASIVATKYLYLNRQKSPENKFVVSILGCGAQGRMHAIGFCNSFENISEIRLWNRTSFNSKKLSEELENLKSTFPNKEIKIYVTNTVEGCVANSNVIITATYSSTPILQKKMINSNVHINAVGAGVNHHSELSEEIYNSSTVYIDNWASARVELKDLQAKIECEIGDVINETHSVADGITIFQSMGMAAEDATVAQAVYEALKTKS